MCDSKEKSSYEHGSDFERLRIMTAWNLEYKVTIIDNKRNKIINQFFHAYFYWGFQFLKGSLRDVFISRSAL
jgi:predicted mannosyl-3-phosphoglycerate phosphatase (HAD superfamily)